jgi:flagellar biosynthesis protein FlhG
VLDGDLGMANVHIVTGVYPDYDLMDVVEGKKTLKEIIIKGPGGIDIIPGASGLFKLSNISHQKRHRLTEQLNLLDAEYDLIVLDTEAGMSHNVMKFISISDRTIVIATPDLTSLSDAYAIIKVIKTNHKSDDIGVVINRVRNLTEADAVFRKLNMASEKFLKYSLKNYGFILDDPLTVKESIQKRSPVSFAFSKTKVGNSIRQTTCRIFGMQDKKIVESSGMILNRFSMLLESVKTS